MIRVKADVEWNGGACSCAASNPPSLTAISAVFDELAAALAISELAGALGLPDAADLRAQVVGFVETSPSLQAAAPVVETGSAAGQAAKRLLDALGKRARGALEALQRAPTKPFVLGAGVLLASQALASWEATRLEAISTETALIQDTVMGMPPELRAKALADLLGARSGGLSVWEIAALAGGLGLVVLLVGRVGR